MNAIKPCVAVLIVILSFLQSPASAQTCARGGSARLEAAGLCLRWAQQLKEADLGRPVTAQILYGDAGEISETVFGDPEYRFVGRAPDGQLAIEMRVPAGHAPSSATRSRHFAEEERVTHAGYSVDVYIPASFEFPRSCIDTGYRAGAGRWPFGMWIGGRPFDPADTRNGIGGGVRPAEQTGISVRLNRIGRGTGQDAPFTLYIYNLNRVTPECQATSVCSTICDNSTPWQCFGYSTPQSVMVTPRGRWVTVESELRQNDPGTVNGVAALWVNGRAMQRVHGLDLGRDRNWFIRGFYGYEMWHCQESPKAQKYWFRNLKLYAE